jgi:hypothetical protein
MILDKEFNRWVQDTILLQPAQPTLTSCQKGLR